MRRGLAVTAALLLAGRRRTLERGPRCGNHGRSGRRLLVAVLVPSAVEQVPSASVVLGRLLNGWRPAEQPPPRLCAKPSLERDRTQGWSGSARVRRAGGSRSRRGLLWRGPTPPAENKLKLAAAGSGEAMRASEDFNPVMTPTGACHAVGGRTRRQRRRGRIVLIREAMLLVLHLMSAGCAAARGPRRLPPERISTRLAPGGPTIRLKRRYAVAAMLWVIRLTGGKALDGARRAARGRRFALARARTPGGGQPGLRKAAAYRERRPATVPRLAAVRRTLTGRGGGAPRL